MTDDSCQCSGAATESTVEHDLSEGHWIEDGSVLDAELPDEVQSALGRFLGRESVETLGEWADELHSHTGGDSIGVDDLCLTDEETAHWGVVDGDRYYFACFYDAVILAALWDRPVDVRTESPNGTVVEARAVGSTDLRVTPAGAVFSFGIDRDVDPPSDEGPSLERGYAAICPYVRAFPDAAAYERWTERAPAVTVAMPLAGATNLAAALAKGSPD